MNPMQWLRDHDRGLAALRRAARTAIIMPALFAVGDKVLDRPDVATFAAFGSFAMLLLVDFNGPMRSRLQAQALLGVTGAVFVVLGTLASRWAWLAALAMAIVGFAVIFSGVVSSVLAGATTALLLSFILPVSLSSPVSAIPQRLAGWGLAATVAFFAIWLLWPAPVQEPLRRPTATAARALAARLRADSEYSIGAPGAPTEDDRSEFAAASDQATAALQKGFLATPYRPTGLSTATRTLVRLVDELRWLTTIAAQSSLRPPGQVPNHPACAVKIAAAGVLDRSADAIEGSGTSEDLTAAVTAMTAALDEMERSATVQLPLGQVRDNAVTEEQDVDEFITALDPTFRAQELAFAVSQLAGNVRIALAAEHRGWLDRLLGQQPEGLASPLSAARQRAAAHIQRHSVWLHNSLRGAVGLGLAVLVANLTGVQHSFWVVLGALSVLRSNALNTGQNALRGLLGTVAGFIIGAIVLQLIGTNRTLLWFLLPLAILLAGVAPAVISFAAGQAGFTLTLVILFNITAPAGWKVGLLRVEDIAIGCAVSLAVGLLFWPRGASAALARALSDAYVDSAAYLAGAVEFGMLRCDGLCPSPLASPPTAAAERAAAAARRLDDTYRTFLAERGAKPVPLAEITSLVSGVVGLRLAADAVLDLWQRDDGTAGGDRRTARSEVLTATASVHQWYDDLAAGLVGQEPIHEPLPHDRAADARLVDAVRRDLRGNDGRASATAVRMIWTGDHIDAARRLQQGLVEPARTAASERSYLDRLIPVDLHPQRRRPEPAGASTP